MAVRKRKKRRAKRKAPRYVRTPRQVGRGLKPIPASRALSAAKMLAKSYEAQIDEIGEILIRHGVITKVSVERDGVRFAVLRRFEPRDAAYESKRPR